MTWKKGIFLLVTSLIIFTSCGFSGKENASVSNNEVKNETSSTLISEDESSILKVENESPTADGLDKGNSLRTDETILNDGDTKIVVTKDGSIVAEDSKGKQEKVELQKIGGKTENNEIQVGSKKIQLTPSQVKKLEATRKSHKLAYENSKPKTNTVKQNTNVNPSESTQSTSDPSIKMENTPKSSSSSSMAKKPVITKKTITNKEIIPYSTTVQNDPKSKKGSQKILQHGKNGERTILTEITYQNGEEISRKTKMNYISKEPVKEIVAKGTLVWVVDKNAWTETIEKKVPVTKWVKTWFVTVIDPNWVKEHYGEERYSGPIKTLKFYDAQEAFHYYDTQPNTGNWGTGKKEKKVTYEIKKDQVHHAEQGHWESRP